MMGELVVVGAHVALGVLAMVGVLVEMDVFGLVRVRI